MNNDLFNTNEKDMLLLFLMKDFIKNHSLENLSEEIFSTLIKKNILKSTNITDEKLENVRKTILQNIPFKTYFNKSRFINDFSIFGKIGKGGFGSVFGVINKLDKKKYAIKIVNVNTENKENVKREVENLSLLNHPNIIRYYGSWLENIEFMETHKYLEHKTRSYANESYSETYNSETYNSETYNSETYNSESYNSESYNSESYNSSSNTKNLETTNYLFLQMEIADTNLKEIQNKLTYEEKRIIFRDIVLGLNQIHKQNIIHRDLKPSNILIIDGKVKIGDFGLSKNLNTKFKQIINGNVGMELTGEMGSLLYSSPEQLLGKEYDYRTDIYSLGIILFELLNNFNTDMEKNIEITKLKNDESTHIDELNFIKMLINTNFKKRPNTNKILEILESQ